jgi:uncharacterized protein YqgC (DUF456 family)
MVALPGNWLIVAFSALYAWLLPAESGHGIGWVGISVLVVLAVVGEVLEFAAGVAAAGQRGASRRGMAMAVVGTMVGSLAGAFVSLPVPVVGPLLGALAGGALGAFGGTWLGELWKGRTAAEGVHIGTGAMIGRLLGTTGKLAIGALMVMVAFLDAIL